MRNTNFECSVIFWCGRIQAPNILSRKNDIGFSRKRIYFSLSISMSVLNALLNLLLQFHSKTFLSTVIIIIGINVFFIVMQVHFFANSNAIFIHYQYVLYCNSRKAFMKIYRLLYKLSKIILPLILIILIYHKNY